nr:uncharacterized protein LOC109176376 [Ipomoea trifida]
MGSDEYSLVYGGKMLEEEKTLAFLGIANWSRLYVVLNPRDVIQVSVKGLNGETVETQLRLLHTIFDVVSVRVGSTSIRTLSMEASCPQSSNSMAQQEQEEEDEVINISVKIIKTMSLQISKFETVGELKTLLYEREGIPDLHQELFFKDNHLMNEKTRLFDYGIRSNTTVSAYIGNSEILSLMIEMPSRKTSLDIEATPQDTVQSVKDLIGERENDVETQNSSGPNSTRNLVTSPTLGIASGNAISVAIRATTLNAHRSWP